MKNRIKAYIIPLALLSLNFILSFTLGDPVFAGKVIYTNLLLLLFSLLAIHLQVGLGQSADQSQKNKIKGLLLILSILAVLFFIFFVPISRSGGLSDPYFIAFLLSLLVLNILLYILTIDWGKRESRVKAIAFFGLLLVLAALGAFILYSPDLRELKASAPISYNFQVTFRHLLGLVPMILLLIQPNFPRKEWTGFKSWWLAIPGILVGLFFIATLLDPNPYRTDQYLAYLEENNLLGDGEFQSNLDLSYPERKAFVAYSEDMVAYPLPDDFRPIDFLKYSSWETSYYQMEHALFRQTFGFDPVTLLSPWENSMNVYSTTEENIEITTEQILAIVGEGAGEFQRERVFFFNLDEEGGQEVDFKFTFLDEAHKLRAELGTSPETYVVTLENPEGVELASLDLFAFVDSYLSSGNSVEDPEAFVVAFEDGERSGYLMIPYINFNLQNKETVFDALLFLEKS